MSSIMHTSALRPTTSILQTLFDSGVIGMIYDAFYVLSILVDVFHLSQTQTLTSLAPPLILSQARCFPKPPDPSGTAASPWAGRTNKLKRSIIALIHVAGAYRGAYGPDDLRQFRKRLGGILAIIYSIIITSTRSSSA